MRPISCALVALMGAAGIGCGADSKPSNSANSSNSATSGAMEDEEGACSYASAPETIGEITIKNETDSEIFFFMWASFVSAVAVVDGTERSLALNAGGCLQDCATPFEPLACGGDSTPSRPWARIIAGGQLTRRWVASYVGLHVIPASCGEVGSEILCWQRFTVSDGTTIRYKAYSRVTCLRDPEACTCEPDSDGSCFLTEPTSDELPDMTAEFTYRADQREELSVAFTE